MRGSKPLGKIAIKWSSNFAYAIGLLATDGCLYNNGRHMNLTTKDLEQAENFKLCLNLSVKIGTKYRNSLRVREYYYVQFGDVLFYRFLESIGMTPAKTKTIGQLLVPKKYFFDFLRGHLDGDGTFYSYYDPRWKSSFMFYTTFVSASKKHIDWIRQALFLRLKIKGHITRDAKRSAYNLKYAKRESMAILRKIYYNAGVVCLRRKRVKIQRALAETGLNL